MITWLTSKVGKAVSIVAGVVISIFAIFQLGRRDQRKDTELEEAKEYLDTKERIDEIDINTERDAAIKRLRKNGHLR